MKKALSLILALTLCLSLCACGGDKKKAKESPIVGTWHTYATGVTSTYTFKANGKYSLDMVGSFNMEDSGTYTFNEENGTVTFNSDDSGEDATYKVEIRDCCMILNSVQYGKVYSKSESCDVLDIVLGKWVHTSLEGTYLTFNKDGTCSLTTPSGTDTGIYIYDPVTEKVEIPNADLIFVFEENGNRLSATNTRGFYFKR